MKRLAVVFFLAIGSSIVLPFEAQAQNSAGKVQVTFVSAQQVATATPCCYDTTDRPLTADAYAYNVSLKSACTIYTGRYENFVDYFPEFKPGQLVDAQIGKHAIVLRSPGGDSLRMSIVGHQELLGAGRRNA